MYAAFIFTIIVYLRLIDALCGRHRKNDVEGTVTHKTNVCNQKTQGIARLVDDKENPTVGTEVTLLLENNTIKLFKGNKDVKRFTLTSVKTPILIKTSECLSIHDGKGESLLCFPNSYSLNNWWMSITKQILCNNQGDVRNEVYGEASLEEIQTDVDSLHSDEDKRGINIHIDEKDPAKLPQIKVHYKE